MNDFETVRQGLQDALNPEPYEAALDRIEAEMKEYEEQARQVKEEWPGVKAEVERLRDKVEWYENWVEGTPSPPPEIATYDLTRRQLEDEVERLRAENKTLRMATQPGVYEELSEYQHEVERLRELSDRRGSELKVASETIAEWKAEIDRLQAEKEAFLGAYPRVRELEQEVERLQGDIEAEVDARAAAEDEAERLKEVIRAHETNIRRLRAVLLEEGGQEANWILDENERLQRLVAAYEDIELVKEVERLRAEIARYKADPTLLLDVDESKVIYFPEEKE